MTLTDSKDTNPVGIRDLREEDALFKFFIDNFWNNYEVCSRCSID